METASTDNPAAIQRLRDSLCGNAGATAEDLRRQGTVHFIERSIAPANGQGGYRTRRWDELVAEYAEQSQPKRDAGQAALEMAAALIAGAASPVRSADDAEYPLLLPKVHAFFSQGQPITACLGHLHLSATGELQCA